jgi:GNAT superfamily N-acetyltransferase
LARNVDFPANRERKLIGMGTTLEIRQGTLDDIPTMVNHRRWMFESMGNKDTDALDLMDVNFEKWVQPRLLNGEYVAWFATHDQQIVAGAALWLMPWPPHVLSQSGPRAYILNVYTEPAYRKQGLAQRLVSTILEWCREQSIDVVTLHASDQGRSIYEAMGFTASNEMRMQLSGSKPE